MVFWSSLTSSRSPWWSGQTGRTKLKIKLYFPGDFCRTAFAILAMFPVFTVSFHAGGGRGRYQPPPSTWATENFARGRTSLNKTSGWAPNQCKMKSHDISAWIYFYSLTNQPNESNDQRLGIHDNMYYTSHIDFDIHQCYLTCYLVQIGFLNRESHVMMHVAG